ncbi:glutathione S-transferase, partial [Meredithblackwellia eburnea MCA 4105]
PNGFKVAIVLHALGLSYKPVYLDFKSEEHKKDPYLALNPNGRIPTLVDYETGFTLWESAAIIQYLVEKYDTEHKISAESVEDKFKQIQWLSFQISGQGPYFGQAVWFKIYHPDKVPSAVDRYVNEALRVLGVLESTLSKSEAGVLVGDKVSFADLSFLPWNEIAFKFILPDGEEATAKRFPAVQAWREKCLALDYVKAATEA